MPASKRSTSTSNSSPASRPAAKRTTAAAKSGTKATTTSARKAASRTATQAKSGATKTAKAASAGAASTRRSAKAGGATTAAKTASRATAKTAKTAKSGAKGTATAAKSGAKATASTAKRASTSTRKASGGSETIASVAEQLGRGVVKPRDVIMLTRDRIQETLDEAASRGRVTRKDANDLVAELVRRGRHEAGDIGDLFSKRRGQIESAAKRAVKAEPVDRIVRGADRARRAAGVGPSFPILGYDDLNAPQIQSRLGDLSKPDLRKVLTYERKNADRKSVVGALEKAIG